MEEEVEVEDNIWGEGEGTEGGGGGTGGAGGRGEEGKGGGSLGGEQYLMKKSCPKRYISMQIIFNKLITNSFHVLFWEPNKYINYVRMEQIKWKIWKRHAQQKVYLLFLKNYF